MTEPRFKELHDEFEGDKLSDIWSNKKFEEGRVELQTDVVRKGKGAVKITIQEGDKKEANTERDELLEKKEFGPYENESYRYSFSVYIPEDFPIVPTRLVLAQWKQDDVDDNVTVDNPVLALRYVSGELYITLQTTEEKRRIFSTKEEIRGKWIDFVFEVKFTRTENGLVRVLMNNKQIVNHKGITAYSEQYNYPSPGRFYFKMGLYRDQMEEPMTVYFDEFHKKFLGEQ